MAVRGSSTVHGLRCIRSAARGAQSGGLLCALREGEAYYDTEISPTGNHYYLDSTNVLSLVAMRWNLGLRCPMAVTEENTTRM